MSLKGLKRNKADTVIGIDSSTNSLAFCIFNEYPLMWGKIEFRGDDIYKRIYDARNKTHALSEIIKDHDMPAIDYIALESSIMVRSQDVAIKMSMVLGSIISALIDDNHNVITVAPISWQSYIGNKNFTKAQKDALKKEFPSKSEVWYRNKIRDIRKGRTMTFMKDNFNIIVEDNDVGDAMGIAYFAYHKVTGRK